MAYTPPVAGNWDTDDYFVAANFKTEVLDNITYLKTAADTRAISVEVFAANVPVSVGDGKRIIGPMPAMMAGYNLTKITINVKHESSSGLPTVAVRRGRCPTPTTTYTWEDMLSTNVTIDANEFSSVSATTAMVVNTTKDDIAEGDLIAFDVDVAGTDTLGLWVTPEFNKP
jgi:hypothetical protein